MDSIFNFNCESIYCLNFIPQAIVIQKNNKIVYCNNLTLNILHKSNSEELLNKNLWNIITNCKRINKKNKITVYEGIYEHSKGHLRNIELKVSYNDIENENCEFIVLNDITNIKNKMKISQEIKQAYANSFRTIPLSIFVSVNKKFLFVNSEGFKILGLTNPKQVIGEDCFKFYHPDKVKFHKYRHELLLMCREPLPFIESKILNSKGNYIPVETMSFPLNLNDVTAIVTVVKDISKNKKIQLELLNSEEKYKKLMELLPDGICVHDSTGCVYANEIYSKLCGFPNSNAIIGNAIAESIPKQFAGVLDNRINEALNRITTLPNVECKLETSLGKTFYFETTSSSYYDAKKIMVLSTIKDITEKKNLQNLYLEMEKKKILLEKNLEYDKVKTEFFANISHELKTPLNLLFSSLQLVNMYLENINSDKTICMKKYMAIMKQNCYRLLRLIDNIIDITKVDTGQYPVTFKKQNIVLIVEDICQSMAGYFKNKNLNLIFDTDVEEKFIYCNEDMIDRIILNLLSNSVKFSNPGGEIKVTVYDKGKNVVISVKDNGIGIPDDKVDIIFERFSQVDKSLRRVNEGSGIGLSIVKKFVEVHKGSIEVNSTFGKGTEFIITLPDYHENSAEEPVDLCYEQHVSAFQGKDQSKVERMNIEFSDIYS